MSKNQRGRNLHNLKYITTEKKFDKEHLLKFTYWNARSAVNKTTSLYDYLSTKRCDFLILTETWFKTHNKTLPELDENQVTFAKLLPKGFTIEHDARPDGRLGGGVALIFSDSVSAKIQKCHTHRKFKQFESMSVLITFRNASFCLTVVYRPSPSKKNKLKLKCFWKDWTDLLTIHTESNSDFVIVGDLNLHLNIATNTSTIKFNGILDEFNLTQHIQEQTHVCGNALDVLLSNSNSNNISKVKVFDPDFFNDEGKPVRDHYAIKWLMKGTKKKPKIEEFKSRNWKGINPEAFSSDLHTLISPAISEPVDLVLHYNSVLENLRESHAPLVTKKKYRFNLMFSII